MRPRGPRPDALQSVAVLEILAALDPQHGEAGVPFKDLEATARSRLNYRGLTDALNALVNDGGPPASVRNQPASGSPASDERGSTSTDHKQERLSEVNQHPGGTPWPTSCFGTIVQRTPGTGRSTTATSGTGLRA